MGHEFLECRVPSDLAEPQDLCGELLSGDVTCLDSDLEVRAALALLDASGVPSAPVVDDNSVLVGVVSTRRLARLRDARGAEVDDAMDTDVISVSERAPIAEVARLVARHSLERVPVVTHDGHLVGMLTATDLVRWFASRL